MRSSQYHIYSTMSDSVIIIPTYNEKENIERMIRTLMALEHGFDVLVVDDGSPDGTAAIVKEMMSVFPKRVHIIERSGKLGLGTAYITGFKWALEQGYEYIFEMDADFSHNPDDVPRLYAACADEGYDLSVGSRYVSGVNVVNWPMGRVLMSYFASKYVRFITRLPVHDTTAGFNCYKRKVLETMELDRIRFKGYAFQIEMKFTTHKCGFKIKEVPVIFVNRVLGTSKMSGGIFSEALFGVVKLKVGSWFRKYPKANLGGTEMANDTNKEFEKVLAVCRELFSKKLYDYGASWRIMRPESLTDQIFIKAKRIRNLETGAENMVGEDIVSEFIGIVNYGLISLVQLDKGYADACDMSADEAMALYDEKAKETLELMKKKNHDYNEAWRGMRTTSYTDLILTKIWRTKQIEELGGATKVSEGVDANYMDMINYAVFALIKNNVAG